MTKDQTVPLLVMTIGFISSGYTILRMVPGSTSLTLTSTNILIRQFWRTKPVQYTEVTSLKLLGKGESRGLNTRKAIILNLKNGKRVMIPDCHDILKEELAVDIQNKICRI